MFHQRESVSKGGGGGGISQTQLVLECMHDTCWGSGNVNGCVYHSHVVEEDGQV
jgi:hypothetical protein